MISSDEIYNWLKRDTINIDTSNKCTLQCPKCVRTKFKKNFNKIPGGWLTDYQWSLHLKHFNKFVFSGQVSDPILHPKMDKMLGDIYKENKKCIGIHVAASHKKPEWFKKCFKANPDAWWFFGIDGLPKDSHKYRVNQDGEKLYEMMVLSKKYIKNPVWQYIIFKYNENDIDTAKNMADKEGIRFRPIMSSRYKENDPYKPSSKFVIKRNDWDKVTLWQKNGNQDV